MCSFFWAFVYWLLDQVLLNFWLFKLSGFLHFLLNISRLIVTVPLNFWTFLSWLLDKVLLNFLMFKFVDSLHFSVGIFELQTWGFFIFSSWVFLGWLLDKVFLNYSMFKFWDFFTLSSEHFLVSCQIMLCWISECSNLGIFLIYSEHCLIAC